MIQGKNPRTARNTLQELRNGENEQSYLVARFALQSAAVELMPEERVSKCLRYMQPTAKTVEIRKREKKHTAFFKGLIVCASVWMCPVCAARISEKRRKELTYAVNNWNGFTALITYTASHNKHTRLAPFL